jgi:reversibly glycosylated polypeptide/UDP-arabinopyranose mutase
MPNQIGVVIPTIREEQYKTFLEAWKLLFKIHEVCLVTVHDGDNPILTHAGQNYSVKEIMGEDADLIYNKNDGVRNLGFAFISKHLPNIDTIITLDDDTLPLHDTIQDHLDTLNKKVPISWFSTASEYMRGFPYGVREEAEVVLSHGLWQGVKDWDAPTQLTLGNRDVTFYQGPIPKGIYYPMCGMNIAFKRKMLPYMYYAPMGYKVGMDRFADIWLGIESKRIIDKNGWAVYSGGAFVEHNRASNVWANLKKEVQGLALNETFWQGDESDPYFKEYKEKRERWEKFINEP